MSHLHHPNITCMHSSVTAILLLHRHAQKTKTLFYFLQNVYKLTGSFSEKEPLNIYFTIYVWEALKVGFVKCGRNSKGKTRLSEPEDTAGGRRRQRWTSAGGENCQKIFTSQT